MKLQGLVKERKIERKKSRTSLDPKQLERLRHFGMELKRSHLGKRTNP